MHRPDRHPGSRPRLVSGGRWPARIVASTAAILLVLSTVAPAWAGSGPTRLLDPTVSPPSGSTSTTVTVSVSYRNREGSPADWVRVTIAGTARAMAMEGGTDWKKGVTFRWSGKLPVGSHPISIAALSRDRFSDEITAGSVTITAPETPPPTPRPTLEPTPRATPRPTPRPTPSPTPRPTQMATARPTSKPPEAVAPTNEETAASPGMPLASPSDGGGGPTPAATQTPSPMPSDDTVAVVPGSTDERGGGGRTLPAGGTAPDGGSGRGGEAWAAVTAGLELLTGGRPTVPLGLVATLVTTSGIVGATFAFGLFGKRRRDGEQPAPDDVLWRASASPLAVAAAAAYAERSGHDGSPDADASPPKPVDPEMAMPRWRRPSLLEARKADPIRDATDAPRLTFDHGLVGPIDGRERRLIRYSLVRLLDLPDELRGTELAFLDQGDEVQLLEKRGAFWMVLCPDGRQGWIHKMTLGEIVGAPPVQSTPTATMPIAADTWTMGDDVDGDVLSAYLESRRRV